MIEDVLPRTDVPLDPAVTLLAVPYGVQGILQAGKHRASLHRADGQVIACVLNKACASADDCLSSP